LSPAHAEQLRGFWQEQLKEIHQVPCDTAEFKNHQLPLARIKKVMVGEIWGAGAGANAQREQRVVFLPLLAKMPSRS
jgi:hypothetical protein